MLILISRLDVFFQHHKMFLDLSIPRFKYRLTFRDRRRPSLALLNAMVSHSSPTFVRPVPVFS